MKIAGFDWDTGNWPKCAKHGVSKDEIEYALFHDPLIAPDPAHSGPEDRYIVIGRNRQGRPMFIGVTFRMVDGEASYSSDHSALYACQGGETL